VERRGGPCRPETAPRWRDFSSALRERFGCRVHKISLDAGFTCPNRDGTLGRHGCIYCNARGSGTGAHDRGLSVTAQLEAAKAPLVRRYGARRFIAYFQAFSNTYAPVERLRALYDEALAVPDVVGLAIGTRPDCVPPEVLELLTQLARQRLVWIEYGLQSACDATLARIGRGHDFACFAKAVALTRGRGIQICAHLILGLPGEGAEEMNATARAVAALNLDGVKLHLLYVARATPLEALLRAGDYRPLEQDEYVRLVCDVIERLPPHTIIQRLTGDPRPDELVAPRWALDKSGTLARIRAELQRRDSWQGKRWEASVPSPPD
jgi:hypothetical protein